jgi:hypothetical protein
MRPRLLSWQQTLIACASLAAVSYLGNAHVLTSDAVSGIVGAIVTATLVSQGHAITTQLNGLKNGNQNDGGNLP